MDMDSLAVQAMEEVLTVCERKYGVSPNLPDALTSTLLLASLSRLGGSMRDIDALVDERVVEPFYRDLWKVWLTGRPDAILEPDDGSVPERPADVAPPEDPPAADAVGALPPVTDVAAAIPGVGTASIPINQEALHG